MNGKAGLPEKGVKNRFLVLGRAGMDLAAAERGQPLEQGGQFISDLGGSSANIAVGIARLGGKAALATSLSDDAIGRFCVNRLRDYGVDTHQLRLVGGEARSSLALYDIGVAQPQTVIYRNGAADFQFTEEQAEALDYSPFGTLILTGTALAGQPSRDGALRAIDLARQAGLAVVMDMDYRPYSWGCAEEARRILCDAASLCSGVIANDEEFAILAGAPERGLACARELARNGAHLVVYKMGVDGSVTLIDGREIRTGIYPVEALKPNGAGDSFLAGLLTSRAEGRTIEEALRRGAACAAMVVARPGCASAMPTHRELEAFFNTAPAIKPHRS